MRRQVRSSRLPRADGLVDAVRRTRSHRLVRPRHASAPRASRSRHHGGTDEASGPVARAAATAHVDGSSAGTPSGASSCALASTAVHVAVPSAVPATGAARPSWAVRDRSADPRAADDAAMSRQASRTIAGQPARCSIDVGGRCVAGRARRHESTTTREGSLLRAVRRPSRRTPTTPGVDFRRWPLARRADLDAVDSSTSTPRREPGATAPTGCRRGTSRRGDGGRSRQAWRRPGPVRTSRELRARARELGDADHPPTRDGAGTPPSRPSCCSSCPTRSVPRAMPSDRRPLRVSTFDAPTRAGRSSSRGPARSGRRAAHPATKSTRSTRRSRSCSPTGFVDVARAGRARTSTATCSSGSTGPGRGAA